MLIRAIVLCSLLGFENLNFERKNEINSGSCSQMTPSRKWPIEFGMKLHLPRNGFQYSVIGSSISRHFFSQSEETHI